MNGRFSPYSSTTKRGLKLAWHSMHQLNNSGCLALLQRQKKHEHALNYSDMFRLFLLTSRRYRRVWLSQLWQTCRKNPRSFTNLLSPAFCSFSHKSHSKPSVSSESISKSFGTSFSWKISTTFAGVTNPGFSRQRNPKYQSKHNI